MIRQDQQNWNHIFITFLAQVMYFTRLKTFKKHLSSFILFSLSLLMSACLGLVPSEVILYSRPVPPAMVPPLLRTYGDASASNSAVAGNLLVFHSFWFPTDTTYHVSRDPTSLSRSLGLSSIGGTPIPLT